MLARIRLQRNINIRHEKNREVTISEVPYLSEKGHKVILSVMLKQAFQAGV